MIIRLWKAQVLASELEKYFMWERTRSLPMFQKLDGCLGVLFLRSGGFCFALSFWCDMKAVDALEHSELLHETTKAYEESGMLIGSTSLQVFEAVDGFTTERLLRAVARTG